MTLSRNLAHMLIKNRTSVDDVVAVLAKYKLLSVLPSVLSSIKQQARSTLSENMLRIETPYPLSEQSISAIKSITGGDAHTISINEALLAGFKARFKGKLYDASAQRVLEELTNHAK